MLQKVWKRLLAVSLLVVIGAVSIHIVLAHGSMSDPVSRVLACYLEGPESPDTVVCSNVIASSGTQPLYDWNEVNQSFAGGNHQALIPDGQLCSGGRAKYAAFDEPRTDWQRTILPDGGTYTFLFDAFVPHNQGYFELWVTKDGYDPNQPLAWDDIEMFALVNEPPVIDGAYYMPVELPEGKSGHHVIYAIWQRNDSAEAFYSCSDVWFGNSPTPTPTTAPACTAPPWNSAITYSEGDIVSYNNSQWMARWGNAGSPPSSAGTSSAPWRIQSYCTPGGPLPTATSVPPTATATSVPNETPTSAPPTSTSAPPTATSVPPTATTPPTGGVCEVDYNVVNIWGAAFQANVTITNNDSSAVSGWTLTWTHAPGQSLQSAWNATVSQTGNNVTASNPASHWNGTIGASGGSVSFGLIASHTGSAVIPTDFVLNGVACNGAPPTATPVPPTATSAPPTATSAPPTATSVPPTATSVPPTATSVPPTATPGTGSGCTVVYDDANDWGGGFVAYVTIGVDAAVPAWTLAFDFSGNQTITNLWGGLYSQSGGSVTVNNESWNGNLPAGGTATFGFQASYSGVNNAPAVFTLNGEVCD